MLRIAHRGASGYCPENTLASFKKAIELGACAIEFDVQMTRDEEIVVIHDYSLERTTNGKGLVMDADSSYIKSLDAGSSFKDSFKGEQVPTLDEVLKLVPKDILLNIEIKKLGLDHREVIPKILEIVNKNNRVLNTVYSSFDHNLLAELKNKGISNNGLLLNSAMINPWDYIQTHDLDCESINISADFINQALVEKAHLKGFKVYVYTVNSPDIATLLESFSVDGIFTNYIDTV